MTTYNIHDLVWSRGVSEPVREAMLAMNGRIAELSAINDQLLEALDYFMQCVEQSAHLDARIGFMGGAFDKARAAIAAAKKET